MADKPKPASDDDLVQLRALVTGRVQGVFFREFTRQHARRLGLAGWVRNLTDGHTVEVRADGPRSALLVLLAQLRQGPPSAHVEGVSSGWDLAHAELKPFQIL